MRVISFRIPQRKRFFGETDEAVRQERKRQAFLIPSKASARKAQAFTRDKVLNRLKRLPPNVIITDFDQTITSVKSNKDYYEEFKRARVAKNPLLKKKDIL